MKLSEIEKKVKLYSTKKLKEIVDQQFSAYSEKFLDAAKDELILRGESFTFNDEYVTEIKNKSNMALKEIIEEHFGSYHEEYLEVARIEFIKRDLKNESKEGYIDTNEIQAIKEKYTMLMTFSKIMKILAIIVLIGMIVLLLSENQYFEQNSIIIILYSIISSFGLFLYSELIKLLVDIEKNTRKSDF